MYKLLVFITSEFLIFALFSFIIFILRKRDYKTALKITISVFICLILKKILNLFWYEPRPYVLNPSLLLYSIPRTMDSSFFSTHASMSMAFAGATFMSYKKSGLILSLGAILVGIGRVLAGLHFYKDIIWGLGIGFIVSLFVEKTVNWISAVLKLHLKTLS